MSEKNLIFQSSFIKTKVIIDFNIGAFTYDYEVCSNLGGGGGGGGGYQKLMVEGSRSHAGDWRQQRSFIQNISLHFFNV